MVVEWNRFWLPRELSKHLKNYLIFVHKLLHSLKEVQCLIILKTFGNLLQICAPLNFNETEFPIICPCTESICISEADMVS